MKLNLNRSNWFSRVLVGTAILATLGILVPEVVKGNNEETVSVSAQKQQIATTAYNNGQVAIEQQNYQQAIASFNQAIAANPQHAEAYRDRGIAHERIGDYARARADLQQSASLFLQAEDNVALYNTMQLISQVDNPNEPLRVSAEQKQTAIAVYNAGQEAMRSQNYQQAIAYFDQAIATNPQHANAYRDRGVIHELMGDYARAKLDWQKAANLFLQQARQANNLWQQETDRTKQVDLRTIIRQNNLASFQTMQLISRLEKTFSCRQNNGQWETVMNRNSQTYPLIVWHDRRVMDVKNGIPELLNDPILGQIPSSGEIRLIDYNSPRPLHQYIRYTTRGLQAESDSVVEPYVRQAVNIGNNQYDKTVVEGGQMGTISAERRCISVSERLENLTEQIFVSGESAENIFTLATLVKNYQGIDPKTGVYKTLDHNIQVACIPQPLTTECDDANAIFTLSGQASTTVNENNEQRLARFVRLIDNPGSGDPIHN